jgi:hypothetical protein
VLEAINEINLRTVGRLFGGIRSTLSRHAAPPATVRKK